jgi:hypothetical protein
MEKWYEHFGDRDIPGLTIGEMQEIVKTHEDSFALNGDNGHTPDPDAVDFVMVLRRCIRAEEELGRLGSALANLTRTTENAAVKVKNTIVNWWNGTES